VLNAAGFHAFEPVAALRWTDGDAALPADVLAIMRVGFELELILGAKTRYPLFGDATEAATRVPVSLAAHGIRRRAVAACCWPPLAGLGICLWSNASNCR
jgi:hypothetical protein